MMMNNTLLNFIFVFTKLGVVCMSMVYGRLKGQVSMSLLFAAQKSMVCKFIDLLMFEKVLLFSKYMNMQSQIGSRGGFKTLTKI